MYVLNQYKFSVYVHILYTICSTYVHILPVFITDGYGELQFASNDVYRGNWKEGVRHGSVSSYTYIRTYMEFVDSGSPDVCVCDR